jgi:hypothetical protein
MLEFVLRRVCGTSRLSAERRFLSCLLQERAGIDPKKHRGQQNDQGANSANSEAGSPPATLIFYVAALASSLPQHDFNPLAQFFLRS